MISCVAGRSQRRLEPAGKGRFMYHGERLNAWTHLVGAVLALVGATALIVIASLRADARTVTSVAVYGATLVILYGSSTLYHSLRGRAKRFFRRLDHQSIYLLIAGTYTPFSLVSLGGAWGWSLFGVVWGLAALGMLLEFRQQKSATRWFSLALYVAMGWAALVAVVPLLHALGAAGFAWVAAGGAVYTLGIVFYVFDEKFRHWHGIWHLFVVGGSAIHYYAILRYVV